MTLEEQAFREGKITESQYQWLKEFRALITPHLSPNEVEGEMRRCLRNPTPTEEEVYTPKEWADIVTM